MIKDWGDLDIKSFKEAFAVSTPDRLRGYTANVIHIDDYMNSVWIPLSGASLEKHNLQTRIDYLKEQIENYKNIIG